MVETACCNNYSYQQHSLSPFLCSHDRAMFSPNVCKSPVCVLSLQIQYSEGRFWTILTQAGQWPICLNWSEKAHGIASVASIRFHSIKSMRHIHVLKVSKYVFELRSGCSSEQILTFLPKLAFHSTFVPINVTAQMGNKYTKVQIQTKQINSSRYPQATFCSATTWLQPVTGREPTVRVKWPENF